MVSCLAIGLMVGWYSRDVRDLLRVAVHEYIRRRDEVRVAKEREIAAKQDQSGVVTRTNIYQRGKTLDLPPYDLNNATGIVRSPSPAEVKKRGDQEWQQTVNEYAGGGRP